MARTGSVAHSQEELLAIASERVQLPAIPTSIKYEDDADIIYVRFSETKSTTRSESDWDNGIVYDYAGAKLIGIEILDAME